jgi:hypothetical protein
VIGGSGVGDAELNRHPVKEAFPRPGSSLPGEVIPYAKDQFVPTGLHVLGGKQWLIRAAIGIRANSFQQASGSAGQGPKLDLHALRGAAVGEVQNMGGKFRRHNHEAVSGDQ